MFCKHCGAEIQPETRYCPNCGIEINRAHRSYYQQQQYGAPLYATQTATASNNNSNALLLEVILSLFSVFGVVWLVAVETTTRIVLIIRSVLRYATHLWPWSHLPGPTGNHSYHRQCAGLQHSPPSQSTPTAANATYADPLLVDDAVFYVQISLNLA